MNLSLRLDVEGRYGHWAAAMEIPELYREEFEPLRTCDDPVIAMTLGEAMDAKARKVIKARKDAADILARELAKMIVEAMERNDTHNGYRKEQN